MVSSSPNERLIPSAIKASLPIDEITSLHIETGRRAIKALLADHDRLLVLIGPCSIHDVDAALEYSLRLAKVAQKHSEELLVAMRVYIEKPRTTVGWKGLVHDPDLTQSTHSDLPKGIALSRSIMLGVASQGLPVVTEMLSPSVMPFIQDLLSVGVIGARTTESQTHRELSSDMPMPVGFKNATDGSLKPAIDAMTASAQPHTILTVDDQGHLITHVSRGNPDTFVILRGGTSGSNYSSKDIQDATAALKKSGKDAHVIIDCSHGNSNKNYQNQGKVAASIAGQISRGSDITGVMIESNINAGQQDIPKSGKNDLAYGVSVTDGCVGWTETENILETLAQAVKARRVVRQRPVVGSILVSSLVQHEAVISEKKSGMVVHTNEILEGALRTLTPTFN